MNDDGRSDGEEAILESVACAIADGAAVDWAAAEASAASDRTRFLLQRLRAAQAVASAHRIENDKTIPGPAASTPSPRRESPSRWGPLVVVSKIGGGAFGDVFRAHDLALDRDVALKLLRPAAPGEAPNASEARFVKEGRAMARVRHPNVVTVFGADRHDGRAGIWMEFVRGRTLEESLHETGAIGAREAALIGTDLCHALAAVHAEGLVHGDVKTQNVARREGGAITLLDFGASAVMHGAERDEDGAAAAAAGTPYYMAPELFGGAAPSVRTDLYALGVLLYRLVTGNYPVTGTTFTELLDAHAVKRFRPLRDARPDLPIAFVEAVEKALAPDPALRYASAGEMERALLPSLGRAGGPRLSRRFVMAMVTSAAAVVLATLFATWLLGPKTYSVSARLYRQEGTEKRALVAGDPIGRGDRLFLEFRASRPLHVYVLNEDAAGRKAVLFPTAKTLQNPLPVREEPFVLPEAGRYWIVDTSAGSEDILLVASPNPLPEFIAEIAAIPRAGSESVPAGAATARLRGILGLEDGPDAAALVTANTGRLSDAVQALADRSETVSGVFVRRIRLDNPAR